VSTVLVARLTVHSATTPWLLNGVPAGMSGMVKGGVSGVGLTGSLV
jgi:hypothetical protein